LKLRQAKYSEKGGERLEGLDPPIKI